jgi:hypothetical protein
MDIEENEIDPDGRHNNSGWSIHRSLFKAYCWGIDGFLAFSIPLIALEAVLKHFGVTTLARYTIIAWTTAIAHQIIFPTFERLQTLTTKRATPVYRGNWWFNFIVLDHVANEFTSFIVVGGIQALAALWVIENTVMSVMFAMVVEPGTFVLWALSEDFTNKFILRRKSELKENKHLHMYETRRLIRSFQWSLKRLRTRELWLYNLASIALKVGATLFTYWIGDVMVLHWARVASLGEATPGMRALIAFTKTAIYFETFLFMAIRCPDAVYEHYATECITHNQDDIALVAHQNEWANDRETY